VDQIRKAIKEVEAGGWGAKGKTKQKTAGAEGKRKQTKGSDDGEQEEGDLTEGDERTGGGFLASA